MKKQFDATVDELANVKAMHDRGHSEPSISELKAIIEREWTAIPKIALCELDSRLDERGLCRVALE